MKEVKKLVLYIGELDWQVACDDEITRKFQQLMGKEKGTLRLGMSTSSGCWNYAEN